MYNFTDVIKGKFLEELAEITVPSLLTALALSFVLGCFIVLIYRLTYSGVLFNKSFALCLLLLATVTSLAILIVSSNVVLSLGMVGALSIVRFRTAVKEPLDTVFMFWAIVVGIATGAGLVPIAIIATLVIGLLFLLTSLVKGKLKTQGSYLMIVRYEAEAAANIRNTLTALPKYRIKSRSSVGENEELVMEVRMNEKTQDAYEKIRRLPGVREVNLVSFNGSTVL